MALSPCGGRGMVEVDGDLKAGQLHYPALSSHCYRLLSVALGLEQASFWLWLWVIVIVSYNFAHPMRLDYMTDWPKPLPTGILSLRFWLVWSIAPPWVGPSEAVLWGSHAGWGHCWPRSAEVGAHGGGPSASNVPVTHWSDASRFLQYRQVPLGLLCECWRSVVLTVTPAPVASWIQTISVF